MCYRNFLQVFIQFRQFKDAFAAEVEARFTQVGGPAIGQLSLRFLWQEVPTINMSAFNYPRHIFGAQDFATKAISALQRTNQDNWKTTSAQKIYRAQPTLRMLIRLCENFMRLRGLTLTKFDSNAPGCVAKMNPDAEKVDPLKKMADTLQNITHVLGLKCSHNADTLVVSRGATRKIKNSITHPSALLLLFLIL